MKKLLSKLLLGAALSLNPLTNHAQNIAETQSKILFTETDINRPAKAQTRLWVVNPDGSELKKLSDSIYTYSGLAAASFSPDGEKITFKGTDGKHKIIDLEGNVLYRFGNTAATSRSNEDFKWTPDGKAVLYGSYYEGLYKFDLDKDTLIKIRNTPGFTYEHNPVMSPDLKKIVFTHHEYGSRFYNYIIDSQGTRKITGSYDKDTILSSYDKQLNLNWMSDSTILFEVLSRSPAYGQKVTKDVIAYYNINSENRKNFFLEKDFHTMKISKDKKIIALLPSTYSTEKINLVNTSELESDSIKPTETDIQNVSSLAYSSDNKIFCTAQYLGQYGYLIYTYDENMTRHKVLHNITALDSISTINYVDWSSKSVTIEDLGPVDEITIKGKALSNIDGKTIKNGTMIYLSSSPEDTLWAPTLNGEFSFKYESIKPVVNAKIGSKNIPGHDSKELTINAKDSANVSITFTGKSYSLTQPVRITNQYNENISNATIKIDDKSIKTNTNGVATIEVKNITSDENNLPLEKYLLNLNISANKIRTKDTTISINQGSNIESKLDIIQEYNHWIYGTYTTPNSTQVKGWLEGKTIFDGTVSNFGYITNKIISTVEPLILDSIVFSSPAYENTKITSVELVDGGTRKNAILKSSPTAVNTESINEIKSYPNPFDDYVNITYKNTGNPKIIFNLYNCSGQKISGDINKENVDGIYNIQLNGSKLNSGVYIYKLQVGDEISTGKLIKK